MDVIDPSTGRTSSASSNSEQQFIIVHLNTDHNWQPRRPFPAFKKLKLQKRVQPCRLFLGAGEAVENESSLRVRLAQTPSHDVADQVIGNQLTFGHEGLNFSAQRRLLLYMLPQQVAGRNLRNTVVFSNPL